MRRKKHNNKHPGSAGFERLASTADFYAGVPSEKPLYQDRSVSDVNRVRKTARHQAVGGRRKETVDPREKMALAAILRAIVMILLLGLAFFLLYKGISLHEERIFMENQSVPEASPVMREVALVDEFDIASADDGMFADRIETWKKTERMVRSADSLLQRANMDQAIELCQDALRLDPAHAGALKRLGQLYFEKGMHVEAVNAYVRLLSVDPSREEFQLALLRSLDAHGDPEATIAVAHWYQDQNLYSADVQRYLANAYFEQKKHAEAVQAYERVLKDSPQDAEALENLSGSYMELRQYENALAALEKLVAINFRDMECHKRMVFCNAQLGKGEETVQLLGKSAHLFGPDMVIRWLQDPMMDPVRMDRAFQAFTDRVGGEEFRVYLEKMAQTMEKQATTEIVPQLELPKSEILDPEILKPKQ